MRITDVNQQQGEVWRTGVTTRMKVSAANSATQLCMKRRQQTPRVVIGLMRVHALRRLRPGPEETLIGAGVPLSEIENHRRIRRTHPSLVHAITEISTPPLRNMGTLGGNLLLDTRCNYYDQNYEWRQAIDFCMPAST